MKVSGPVPKENVAPVTDVAAVTPLNASVKLAFPTVKGLNCPPVIEEFAFVKFPPAIGQVAYKAGSLARNACLRTPMAEGRMRAPDLTAGERLA
jgi:hypothetical protein